MKLDSLDVDTLPGGLSQSVKSKLKKLAVQGEKLDLECDKTSSKVSKDMCDAMNRLCDKGLTQVEIAEAFGISSRTTVHYHLSDQCKHEYRNKVSHSECGWMRYHANNGAPTNTLAILYNLSEKHARKHVLGRCSHSHECPTPSPEQLRSNGYNSVKDMDVSTCPICEKEFRHRSYNERTTCSEECKYKYIGRKSAEARAKNS